MEVEVAAVGNMRQGDSAPQRRACCLAWLLIGAVCLLIPVSTASIHELAIVESTFSSVLRSSPDEPPRRESPALILQPEVLESAFKCTPHYQPRPALTQRRDAL